MPFFRSLNQTAPAYKEEIPWTVTGLAYTAAFMGPLSVGPVAGLITETWLGVLVGFIVGTAITLAHAWLTDSFIDQWIARFQTPLNRTKLRLGINIIAFGWAPANGLT